MEKGIHPIKQFCALRANMYHMTLSRHLLQFVFKQNRINVECGATIAQIDHVDIPFSLKMCLSKNIKLTVTPLSTQAFRNW